MLFTKEFWKGAAERGIKTFFQVFVATVGVSGVATGIEDINWLGALSVSAVATILSLATSMANADFTAGVSNAKHI